MAKVIDSPPSYSDDATDNTKKYYAPTAEEIKVTDAVWASYERARDSGHEEYVQEAKKFSEFYRGKQWDEADLAKLRAANRPAMTVNMILATCNTVMGEQVSQRADVKFKPRNRGVQGTADALTKMWLQIADNNKYEFRETEVFQDGIIEDRGYFDIRLGFNDHMQGEVKIDVLDPRDVLPDPDAKHYNPDKWGEVHYTRWVSLDEVETLFGKKTANKLRFIADNELHRGRDSIHMGVGSGTRFGDTNRAMTASPGASLDRRSIQRLRMVTRQKFQNTIARFFVDQQTGDMRMIPEDWEEARWQEFAQRFGLLVVPKLTRKVRWSSIIDKCKLSDDWSPYPWFTIVPYFPYFQRGKPFGLVRNLINPQEVLNKVTSQELHIVNTTANSGWMVEAGSLVGMTVDELEQSGAKTGLVLQYAKGSTPPVKITPNSIPTGLDRISMKAAGNLKEISGVSDSLRGFDSNEVSGVAIQAKQARGQVQMQVPFDNLARTRQMVAERVLWLVQNYYTETRIIQVVNEEDPFKKTQPMAVNQPDPATGEIINDLTLGEYDVVISSMPARDSFDESQFAEAIELRSAGVAIPDDMIIEYSHLTRKAELAQRIRIMQGMEQTPEMQEAAKIQAQIEMETLRLEMQKLESESVEIQSRAKLNLAKASQVEGGFNAPEIQVQLAEIEQKIEAKRKELATRERLTELTTQSKMGQAQLQAEIKREEIAANQRKTTKESK